jgi:uncharacterized SAM-binding protein YcdF (DUF218 family)
MHVGGLFTPITTICRDIRRATQVPNFTLWFPGNGWEMPSLQRESESEASAISYPENPRAPHRLLRNVVRWTALSLIAAVLLAGVGFVWFMGRVPEAEIQLRGGADGIVALAGGASRVADAIELLAAGRGKRLLISGANRSTNSKEISRLNPEFGPWVSCCVDFDWSVNTLGNAIETRRWAESRGFRSLIVVTSNYHMPRALAEIAHQLPGVTLVPFPVVTDRQRVGPWWGNAATARRMFSEYVKYIFAKLRIVLIPPPQET